MQQSPPSDDTTQSHSQSVSQSGSQEAPYNLWNTEIPMLLIFHSNYSNVMTIGHNVNKDICITTT
jgi:hypothetical protein